MEGLSAFDGIGVVILLASGLLALVRGFVREALSVAALIVAALAALWARPVFIGLALDLVPYPFAANAIVLGTVFILVFLAVKFITGSLSGTVKQGEDVGVFDRALGFGFGLVRGLVLLGLVLILFASATPGRYPPSWISEARIYPLINASARLLQALAPATSRIADSPPLPAAADAPAATPPARRDPPPAPASRPEPRADEGAYEEEQRRRLDELIGATSQDPDDEPE